MKESSSLRRGCGGPNWWQQRTSRQHPRRVAERLDGVGEVDVRYGGRVGGTACHFAGLSGGLGSQRIVGRLKGDGAIGVAEEGQDSVLFGDIRNDVARSGLSVQLLFIHVSACAAV